MVQRARERVQVCPRSLNPLCVQYFLDIKNMLRGLQRSKNTGCYFLGIDQIWYSTNPVNEQKFSNNLIPLSPQPGNQSKYMLIHRVITFLFWR